MSELGSSTDAPPPPPPPPPPPDVAKDPAPDASPELAEAMSGEGQDAGQSGSGGGTTDNMAGAQEQAADAKTQLEPYQQEPTEVPDGTNVTPNDTPGANRPAGSDGGATDGPPDMDRALSQADAIRPDLRDYQQEPTEVADGTNVTPDLTPSGPPDVSPELAEALPQESEPLATTSDAPDQVVEPAASQYEGQDSPQTLADGEQPVTPDPVKAEEPGDLQAEPDKAESPVTADDTADPVWQRKTWESDADGSDLPPSMKEDLRGLGNDLGEIVEPDAWEKSDLDGRKDMLNAANDRIREEYGLPQQDVSYRSEAEDPDLAGATGYFDPNTGEIVINSSQLADSDPQEALKTLAHENFHDYQDRAQAGDSSDPFAQSRQQEWREAAENYPNENDYEDYADYLNDYQNNPLERDAVAVENEVYAGYKEGKL